jgi:hypothetical protein
MKTVTWRALHQRINRRLSHEDQSVRTARGFWRGPSWYEDPNLGRHYVIDAGRNFIVATHVNLEELARELHVLHPHERVGAP